MNQILHTLTTYSSTLLGGLLILATLIWYGCFARRPIAELPESAQVRELLVQLPGSEGDVILERGSISRFEYWRITRRYNQYVLKQLGIKDFSEAQALSSLAEPNGHRLALTKRN